MDPLGILDVQTYRLRSPESMGGKLCCASQKLDWLLSSHHCLALMRSTRDIPQARGRITRMLGSFTFAPDPHYQLLSHPYEETGVRFPMIISRLAAETQV